MKRFHNGVFKKAFKYVSEMLLLTFNEKPVAL